MNEIFNKAWTQAAPSTWKVCQNVTNNKYDAEDLMQTTWLKTYLHWKNKQPRYMTNQFFTTAARNTLIDQTRKKRLLTIPYDDENQRITESTDTVSSFHFTQLLHTIVANLTVNQQIMFLLADVLSCSLKEIALVTNQTVGAVKATLFRARQKIKNEVKANVNNQIGDEDDVLRVQLYSLALQNGDVQLIASMLTDNASIPALYVQQQVQSTMQYMMAS